MKRLKQNEIKVNHDGTITIFTKSKIYGRKEILIDAEDYPRVKMFAWYLTHVKKYNKTHYARSSIGGKNISMHSLIMSFPHGGQIDHIDRNGLNNTKKNLRVVSVSINALNKGPYDSKSNGMPTGVWMIKNKSKISYIARISYKYKKYNCGTYPTVQEAVLAREAKRAELLGATTLGQSQGYH